MDVEKIVAELTLERRIAEARLADLDEALAMFNRLKDGHRSLGGGKRRATLHHAPPAKKAAAKKQLTAADIDRMRQQYESGSDIDHIGKAFKVTPDAVRYHARTKKWKTPAPKA
jgi:hypothetical protein